MKEELDPKGVIHMPIGIPNTLDTLKTFDEGGGSSSGGWHRVRTTWMRDVREPGQNRSVAMPHGWAISELWLLMRDCLLFEDGERLVLLAGVPPSWFQHPQGMEVSGLMTHFGSCALSWKPRGNSATLKLSGAAPPANGFVLRLPSLLNATVTLNGERLPVTTEGDCYLPSHAKEAHIQMRGDFG